MAEIFHTAIEMMRICEMCQKADYESSIKRSAGIVCVNGKYLCVDCFSKEVIKPAMHVLKSTLKDTGK